MSAPCHICGSVDALLTDAAEYCSAGHPSLGGLGRCEEALRQAIAERDIAIVRAKNAEGEIYTVELWMRFRAAHEAALATAVARAEKAEAYVEKLKIDISGHVGVIHQQYDHVVSLQAALATARAEHLADVKELRADRDNMKTWSAALYAHVCRLTGKGPKDAPKEIVQIAKDHEDKHVEARAQAIRIARALAFEEAAREVARSIGGIESSLTIRTLSATADMIRALAPLSPGLVALKVETVAKVRAALMPCECDPCRAALAALDAGDGKP